MNIKQFRDIKKSDNSIDILFHSYTSISLGSHALLNKFELIKKEDYIKNKNNILNKGIYPKYYNNENNNKEHDYININIYTSKNVKKNDIKDNYTNNYRTENKIMVNKYNEKEKNLKTKNMGRNYSIKSLRPFPPKLPEIYNWEYILNNKKLFSKDNETLGLLNKDNIPNVFYNHLMINKRNSLFHSKYRYNRILIKKRNKNKLLNIMYYFP